MAEMFLTSDTHFGCENTIRYRHRPFETVEEMNDALIDLWNATVQPDDLVWHLGDFAVTDDALEECFPRLNGRIAIIMGNHEQARDRSRLENLFARVYEQPVQVFANGGRPLWFCHYPVQRHDTIYTVTGHIHESWRRARRMLNVGVDAWHFRPVPLQWVLDAENTEQKGYWDANAYPDAPLEWRVWVTSKIHRDHAIYEPTLPSLERELMEAGRPRAAGEPHFSGVFPIDAPFQERDMHASRPALSGPSVPSIVRTDL